MLLGHGHSAAWDQLISLLAPDVDQALIQLILGRSAYSTQEERKAETLGAPGGDHVLPAGYHRWPGEVLEQPACDDPGMGKIMVGAGVLSPHDQKASPHGRREATATGKQEPVTVTGLLLHVCAMRMAAVFTLSTATITLRAKVVPRWIGLPGFAVAVVLLISVGLTAWAELLFPAWILLLSIDILRTGLRQSPGAAGLPIGTQP